MAAVTTKHKETTLITMSNMKDKPTIRQQSSENNSVSSSEWDMANDVFVSGYDENPMGDSVARGERDPMQTDLERHLPLLRGDSHRLSQDGMMLGLGGEEYSGSSYLDIEPNYTESDGNVSTKKRIRSNSSRHRGEVVTELGPEEVRWFYKEDKRTWKPFVGHDSLKIEIVYRRFCEQNPDKVKRPVDPVEAEGKETAKSGEIQPESAAVDGGSVRAEPAMQRGGGQWRSASEEIKHSDISISVEAVCVRGGLYEVDIKEKECYPVYWNQQDRIPVMRGQWFIDGTWLPLEEDESDLIELEHLARFRGQQMRDTYEMEAVTTTVDSKDIKESIHSLKLSRSHVDWHSVDEVYLYSDATTSKIARTVTQKLGFSKASSSGTRLHRGYVEEAAPEDTPPETTHIVFVVHGIGQKMDQGRIIRNTSMMRDAARKMEEKHFSDRTTEHVEFLPVEWRSKLALDGDTVDSITPDKVRGLRDMLNSSAMDIMYYTSPLYRDEINRGLTLELNRLYSLFCSRNPDFEKNGKVSIVSHSLGCVITFDIMTGWDPVRFHHQEVPDFEETKACWPSDEERHLQEQLRLTRLRKLRAPLSCYKRFTGVHRDIEEGFPAILPLKQSLATILFPEATFFSRHKPTPTLLSPQDEVYICSTDHLHQCAAQVAAAQNKILLLSFAVSTMATKPWALSPELAMDIGKAMTAVLTLTTNPTVASYRIMAWQTTMQRNIWLHMSQLPSQVRQELLDALIYPGGLFWPLLQSAMADLHEAAKAEERPNKLCAIPARATGQRLLGLTCPLSRLTNTRHQGQSQPLGSGEQALSSHSSGEGFALPKNQLSAKILVSEWHQLFASLEVKTKIISTAQHAMNAWMSRLITKGYTFQFAGPPPIYQCGGNGHVISDGDNGLDVRVGRASRKAISRVLPACRFAHVVPSTSQHKLSVAFQRVMMLVFDIMSVFVLIHSGGPRTYKCVMFPSHSTAAGGEAVAAPMVQRSTVIAAQYDPSPPGVRQWLWA
eukprot:superscaffoldBa00001889_g12406